VFQEAELGHRVDKRTFDREAAPLRLALLAAQQRLREEARTSVVLVVGGVEGAGKSETVARLNAWMDPRHIETNGFRPPTDEERQRPPMWRFWRVLPPKGRIGVFFGSWYTDPIVEAVEGPRRKRARAALDGRLDDILRFERMLADEGVLVLKYWLHLSKAAQKARLEALARDPRTRWRVTRQDRDRLASYDAFVATSERALRRTSRGHAPWIIIEGTDARYRDLAVGRSLLEALEARTGREPASGRPARRRLPVGAPDVDRRTVLSALDLSSALPDGRYEAALERWQARLGTLLRDRAFRTRAAVLVFEGVDAAGKGGAIRRVTAATDMRWVKIVPVAAPSDEERARPYLWRFWRHLPPHGTVTIFDRSWYGRVLVERVEGFADPEHWERAYGEINDFEDALVRHGTVVVKLWLHISRAEQLRRFRERARTDYKQYKITAEDWRNRRKWPQYEQAVCDMVERTSTRVAPWTLVAAEDKRWARVEVVKTVVRRIEAALDGA
jgi:polyphosphate:AMP phosphotransferase